MAGYRHSLFVLFVLMVQRTVSAPVSSSNSDSGNSDEEKLEYLLRELMNMERYKNAPTTARPATNDTNRPHQVILNGNTFEVGNNPKENQITEEFPAHSDDKRNIRKTTKLWDNGQIKYMFSPESPFTDVNKKKIGSMMDKIANSTCIEWEEIQSGSEGYYVNIENGITCHSRTGDVQSDDGFQVLSLNQENCMGIGTILHELAHTIGLGHEQSRPDRDEYITIHWDNLNGGHQNPNFESHAMLPYKTPFDFTSVMLYSPISMAKHSGSKTFEVKDPLLEQLTLEDRHDLSFYDKLLINRAYDCAGHCEPTNCMHGSFLSNACTCTCPEGLTGELCGSLEQEGNCQNEDRLVIGSIGETVTVESTNYPDSYPTGSTCRWIVLGPKGSKLRVTILDIDIVSVDSHCIHWMELRYNLIAQPGPEFCGDNKGQMMSFTSSDYADAHSMMVTFNAIKDVPSSSFRGFKLEFKAVQGNNATKTVDFCENVNCKNGGTCHYNDNNYWCGCVSEFSGRHCEVASDQNLQTDQNTVFSCDNTNTDECGNIDLGDAWELIDGHFVVKQGQKGPVPLQIPYVISQLDQQYCFHFKISRTGSSQPTCPHLRFIITREMEFYGYLMVYDEYLLFDDDCTLKSEDSEAVSFTSQTKIKKMEFRIDEIKDGDGGKIELSHFRLQLDTCA